MVVVGGADDHRVDGVVLAGPGELLAHGLVAGGLGLATTEHAAEQLGDIVFVELPEAGTEVTKDDEIVVIESVKAASDILAPLDGEIVEVNDALADTPGLVNDDPLGEAWFFKLKVDDLSVLDDLLDEDAYKELIVAAMLYRCGDPTRAAARVLRQYTQDVHGHFARYAERTLDVGCKP